MRRITNRAFTLVELLVVIGIGAIVLGGLAFLYSYTAGQAGDTLAELIATSQTTTVAGEIESTVRSAVSCDTVTRSGVTALRCQMPSSGMDLNGDGITDVWVPSSLDKFGRETFTAGRRVWFYLSDSSGVVGAAGTTFWRAVRSDDLDPTSTDRDMPWTFYYSQTSKPKYTLISNFTVSVDATNQLVTVDLKGESIDYAERKAATSDSNARRRNIHLVSQIYWRNWRT